MKKIIALIFVLLLCLSIFMVSCKDPDDTDTDTSTDSSNPGTDSNKGDKNNKDEEEDDGPSFDTVIEHKLTIDDIVNLGVFDTEISANDGGVLEFFDAENIDVSGFNGSQKEIMQGGVYKLSGVSEGGNILINLSNATEKNITLVLDNLTMISDWEKAPIYAQNCQSLTIIIPSNTTNVLKDTSKSIDKGVIHVKSGNLTIKGKGTLNLESNAENGRGIYCSKVLTIDGGIYNIVSSHSHGIQGQDGLAIKSGEFNITAAKSGLKSGDYDKTPSKNDPEVDIIESREGYVDISGGCFNIKSATNGISSYGYVAISGGKIVLESGTDGIEASREEASKNTKTGSVEISGAITVIKAGDDGIKCDASLSIGNDANIKIDSGNDGIDALSLKASTSGIVYIKTSEAFVEKTEDDFKNDPNEKTYIYKNNRYQEITNIDSYPNETYYKLESCKGVKVEQKIEIHSGVICVDSCEDAFSGQRFDMFGGRVLIDSNDDGIDIKVPGASAEEAEAKEEKEIAASIDGAGNIKITSGTVEIIKSNKGIKGTNFDVSGDPQITVLSSSDAVDAKAVNVAGGFIVLMEKLEVDNGNGEINYTGGTLIVVSSTKKPIDGATLGIKLSDSSDCVYGKWLNISKGDRSLILMLPKSYSDKMSISICAPNMLNGEYNFDIGTFNISGERYNSFVYADGESFKSEQTETAILETVE